MKLAEPKPVVAVLLCCVLLPAYAQVQNANTGELDGLRLHATNVFRNPKQPWPGYGIYLGRGLVITAAHVVGRVGSANPSVVIAGQEFTAEPVKQGDFDEVDLTLLRIDPSGLPAPIGSGVLPLCEPRLSPARRWSR